MSQTREVNHLKCHWWEKQIDTNFAQINLLIPIEKLKNTQSIGPVILLWRTYYNAIIMHILKNLTPTIFIVNIWPNIQIIW